MTEGSLKIDTAPATAAGVAAPRPAAPAAAEAPTLTLSPPEAVGVIAPSQAQDAVKIDPAQAAKLDAMVASYVDGVTQLDTHDAAFASRVRDIQKLGDDDIRASAEVSNRLLQKPLAAATRSGV